MLGPGQIPSLRFQSGLLDIEGPKPTTHLRLRSRSAAASDCGFRKKSARYVDTLVITGPDPKDGGSRLVSIYMQDQSAAIGEQVAAKERIGFSTPKIE